MTNMLSPLIRPIPIGGCLPTPMTLSQKPVKNAANLPRFSGAYGIENHGVQGYLPIQEKRSLEMSEQQAIQSGLSQWIPKLFASYGTPLSQSLASPLKSGSLWAFAAGAGSFLALARMPGFSIPAKVGVSVLGSVFAGALGYFSRQQSNENILDMMQRLPKGATQRDYLSDPVVEASLNRQAMATSAMPMDASAFMLPMLATNLLSSRPRQFSSPMSLSSRRPVRQF